MEAALMADVAVAMCSRTARLQRSSSKRNALMTPSTTSTSRKSSMRPKWVVGYYLWLQSISLTL